jgi:hypothetical protein
MSLKLRPGFPSMIQFDLRHLADHLREIVASDSFRISIFRIVARVGMKVLQENSPVVSAPTTRSGRAESLDIRRVSFDLSLHQAWDFLIARRYSPGFLCHASMHRGMAKWKRANQRQHNHSQPLFFHPGTAGSLSCFAIPHC